MANKFKRGSSANKNARGGAGRVRIIAGKWRGRLLKVEDVDGLRPTGDRVKEMVFNWLQASIAGRQCLDLYAGSGGLGFEAASRYAEHVVLVENDTKASTQISSQIAVFDAADQMTLKEMAAEQFLANNTQRFNLLFLDPPFHGDQLQRVLPLLGDHLASDALVYIECATTYQLNLPDGLELLKEKTIGDVAVRLFRNSA